MLVSLRTLRSYDVHVNNTQRKSVNLFSSLQRVIRFVGRSIRKVIKNTFYFGGNKKIVSKTTEISEQTLWNAEIPRYCLILLSLLSFLLVNSHIWKLFEVGICSKRWKKTDFLPPAIISSDFFLCGCTTTYHQRSMVIIRWYNIKPWSIGRFLSNLKSILNNVPCVRASITQQNKLQFMTTTNPRAIAELPTEKKEQNKTSKFCLFKKGPHHKN